VAPRAPNVFPIGVATHPDGGRDQRRVVGLPPAVAAGCGRRGRVVGDPRWAMPAAGVSDWSARGRDVGGAARRSVEVGSYAYVQ
jgi:hypothetical protein